MGSASAEWKKSSCAPAVTQERQLEPKWEAHLRTLGVAQAVRRWRVCVWAATPDGELPTSSAEPDEVRQTSRATEAPAPMHPVVQPHCRTNSVLADAPPKKPLEIAKTPTGSTPALGEPSLLLL